MSLPETIRTERLELRPFSSSDGPAVLAYSRDPDWAAYQQTTPSSEREAERVVADLLLRDRESRPAWAITRDGRVVGVVTLSFTEGHRVALLGYGIHEDHRGLGLTAEAVRAVLGEAFAARPELARVTASTDLRNRASIRLLEALGFTQEGTLRQGAVTATGSLVDGAIYGLLRSEWEAASRRPVGGEKLRFDEQVAARYDEDSFDMFRPEVLVPAVDLLAELAGDGRALEFGVGTGRVALPLSERGVPVHGIDVSEPMIEALRRKPGAQRIGSTVGDFATTRVEGAFRLVYLVFNTITNLTSQDAQVACFRNAAAHLEPGGRFLIEVGVPDLRRLAPGERVRAFELGRTHLGFDEYTDFVGQIQYSHHYWVGDGTLRAFSAPYRYVWPAELDLMARLAGMSLLGRWADFSREPFTDESTSHVSVWERIGD